MSHNFTTVTLPYLRWSVTAKLVFEHGSSFGIRDDKNFVICTMSPGTFHSPVNSLTLKLRTHIVTTVHNT